MELNGMVVAIIAAAIVLTVGIYVLSTFQSSLSLPLVNTASGYEAVNFTVNNTYYPLAHTIIGTPQMFYYNNATYEIPTARYTYNTTHMKIYANNTYVASQEYPMNISATQIYYAVYTYGVANAQATSTQTSVTNAVWNGFLILGISIIVIAALFIISLFGIGVGGASRI